jgi:(S)-ureidoglycine aminohydrolase
MEPIRVQPFGTTRSRLTRNYALITRDTHVSTPLVGWQNASAVVHIAPEMGARLTQYTAILDRNALSALPGNGVERFVFVLDGEVAVSVKGKQHALKVGSFAFLPADTQHEISTTAGQTARLAVFEKIYQPGGNSNPPPLRIGHESDIRGELFQGDPALRLQVLLPVEPAFDMAVNLFTYDSGGHLPQVEIHVMEHGLLMLEGTGVYRLADEWFPVQAGDVIWMASYCPQWFVAMGKQPARYLYYKDIHRDRLTEKAG